ncbi:CHAD domain-containing protein [Lysobacter sp. 2RAF19]
MAMKSCRSLLRTLSSQRRVHTSIHSARKAIRRLRALLSLLAFVDVEGSDHVLKRVGDSLSALRDAHVAVLTAQRLGKQGAKEAWSPVVVCLRRRRDVLIQRALVTDPGFQLRRARVERVARALAALPWQTLNAADLRSALKRSRRRVDQARRRAKADPSMQNLHRWRRRVRRLRMQLEALAQFAPDVAKKATKHSVESKTRSLQKLGDRLGQRHDEAVLQKLLRRLADPTRDAAGRGR